MKKSSEVLVILLIIILLVVIGLGGYFIYQLNNKIDEKSDEIASLKSSQKTANNEQENINKTSNEDSEKLNEKEALKIGKELYNDAHRTSWSDGFEYELEDGVPKCVKIDDDEYIIIKNYEEVMSKFTKDAEQEFCDKLGIIIKDGQYLKPNADKGSDIYYLSTELKVSNILADEITFNAISSYGVPEDMAEDMELPDDIEETKTDKFVIKKENGKWKVDSFVKPN